MQANEAYSSVQYSGECYKPAVAPLRSFRWGFASIVRMADWVGLLFKGIPKGENLRIETRLIRRIGVVG